MMIIQKMLDPKLLEFFWNAVSNLFKKSTNAEFVRFEVVKYKLKTIFHTEGFENGRMMDYIYKYLKYLGANPHNCKLVGFKKDCYYEPINEFTFGNFRFVCTQKVSENDVKITNTLDIYGNVEEIKKFVDESLDHYNNKKNKNCIRIFRILPSVKLEIKHAKFYSGQTFDNLFIPKKNFYMESLNKFMDGNLSKVSFLLHGEPGCGKTSFIKSVINFSRLPVIDVKLKYIKSMEDLYMLFFGRKIVEFGCNYGKIRNFDKRIIILEDIDADCDVVFKRELKPKTTEDPKKKKEEVLFKPTLSVLLNILDGVTEFRGIVIMTSNHPEKLDPALIRPGRITHNIKLQKIVEPEISQMTSHYFGKSVKIPEGKYTPAELDNICKTTEPESILN